MQSLKRSQSVKNPLFSALTSPDSTFNNAASPTNKSSKSPDSSRENAPHSRPRFATKRCEPFFGSKAQMRPLGMSHQKSKPRSSSQSGFSPHPLCWLATSSRFIGSGQVRFARRVEGFGEWRIVKSDFHGRALTLNRELVETRTKGTGTFFDA